MFFVVTLSCADYIIPWSFVRFMEWLSPPARWLYFAVQTALLRRFLHHPAFYKLLLVLALVFILIGKQIFQHIYLICGNKLSTTDRYYSYAATALFKWSSYRELNRACFYLNSRFT